MSHLGRSSDIVTMAHVILRLRVAREIIGFLSVTDTYISEMRRRLALRRSATSDTHLCMDMILCHKLLVNHLLDTHPLTSSIKAPHFVVPSFPSISVHQKSLSYSTDEAIKQNLLSTAPSISSPVLAVSSGL